ncbi:MAG TPA: hypothetical protein VK897_19910 [Anaerolineales bacterium]|nr:hypothetical protein [Anaerolineales bacterium]
MNLPSFQEIKNYLHGGVPVYRGIKAVKLEQVVGSLNRQHAFDRSFRPSDSTSSERWQRVDRAFYKGIRLALSGG